MKAARQDYNGNLEAKLREVLTFCHAHQVGLIVFPEYAIPTSLIRALRDFSTDMVIVAGLGYLQQEDITTLEELGFDGVEHARPACNAAAILSPQTNALVIKKHSAGGEDIEQGAGPQFFSLEFNSDKYNLAAAICMDFLWERESILRSFQESNSPGLVAIPSLSESETEFVANKFMENPRSYARIFANHAQYGGTYIGAPKINAPGFVNDWGTDPLPAGSEGIVIVDWDLRHADQKPPPLDPTDHFLYARAGLVYKGLDLDDNLTAALSQVCQMDAAEKKPRGDAVTFAQEALTKLRDSGSDLPMLHDAFTKIVEHEQQLREREVHALRRHCLLNEEVLTTTEWRYKQCMDVFKALHDQANRSHSDVPGWVWAAIGAYNDRARSLSEGVRVSIRWIRHRGPSAQGVGPVGETEQLVLLASLGRYDIEAALASLPRQLTLLRTLVDIRDPSLELRYRLRTVQRPEGMVGAEFDILAVTSGRSLEELEALREGLGQLIGVTFGGAYSLNYTTSTEENQHLPDILDYPHRYEIRRQSQDGQVVPFDGDTDWTLVVDLVRALGTEIAIEARCSAINANDSEPALANESTGLMRRQWILAALLSGKEKSASDAPLQLSAAKALAQMQEIDSADARRLTLRIFVASRQALPPVVLDTIAVELAGSSPFTVDPLDDSMADSLQFKDSPPSEIVFNPAEALRIFHPPYGQMYGGGIDLPDLELRAGQISFPLSGIHLGTATIRQVRADERIDVRVSELDRLRHFYVIGKTGTGKTNLLKLMAAQDVKVPGRGVTVIDPHGDLVDYVLRAVPEDRFNEVVLIDLTKTDALPVLNPLDIDRDDITIRDRTIQELIWLLRSRLFHQYTGPRFDEFVRLAFLTMLDPGYPEAASFVEVPRLFMNDEFQQAVLRSLKSKELLERWQFQPELKRDPEFGGLVHWATSKFDEFAKDSTLRSVLGGGRSTVQIDDIVTSGGILLVRIPESVIGKQAADFIGSLILLQLRMAIIRKRTEGKSEQFHFVYVDEFQNFANTDFHTIVAEARKFNIGFTLAHQNLEQLREFRTYSGVHEERLVNAILGNVANTVAFGIGTLDARMLSDHFGVTAENIMRIGKHTALCRLTIGDEETSPFTLFTKKAVPLANPRAVSEVETRMRRERYWIDREETLRDVSERVERVIRGPHSADEKEAAEDDALELLFDKVDDDLFEDRGQGSQQANGETKPQLSVSFPYWEGSIQKVSYTVEDGNMNIIVLPEDNRLKFDNADIAFSKGDGLPTLDEARIRRLKRRKGKAMAKYTVSFPCDEESVDRLSYTISDNYLHIIIHDGNGGLSCDEDNVRFTSSNE